MPRELTLLQPFKTAFRELPDREPGANEIKLRTIVSALSHGAEMRRYRGRLPEKVWDSELRIFRQERSDTSWPKTLGYENIALVESIGERVNSVAVGSMVWLDAPHQEITFASEADVKRGLIYTPSDAWPADLDPAHFTFFVRTRVALGAVHDASIVLGERVAIIGLGVIGLLVAQLAKLNGALEVYGADLYAERLRLAERFGVTAVQAKEAGLAIKEQTRRIGSDAGVDAAFEVSGTAEGLHEAIRCCRVGGRVITVGSYSNGAASLFLGEEWLRNRLTLLGSMTVNGCPPRRYPCWDLHRLEQMAWTLLKGHLLEVDPLISHRIRFDSALEAHHLVDSSPHDVLQVVLDYSAQNSEGNQTC